MDEIQRRGVLGAAGLVGLAAIARTAKAGPLDPPAGPIAPTGRTLDEIYNKLPVTGVSSDGRIMIAGGSGLLKIQSPGSYVLAGDRTNAGAQGFSINSSNVTLDLNGYQISTDSTVTDAVTIASNLTGVTIRNGRISGGVGGVGIGLSNSGIVVEDVHVLNTRQYGVWTPINAARDVVVRRCTFTDIGGANALGDGNLFIAAIYISGSTRITLIDNVVNRLIYNAVNTPTFFGIYASGPGTSALMLARNIVMTYPAISGTGIFVGGLSGVARDNTVQGFTPTYVGVNGINGSGGPIVNGGGNV